MNRSIWALDFPDIADATIALIDNRVGLWAPYSVVQAVNRLFFMSQNGIYFLNSITGTPNSVQTILISKPIDGLYSDKDGNYPTDAVGYMRNANYCLFTPNVVVGVEANAQGAPVLILGHRHWKFYTQSLGSRFPCWYMDEGMFLDVGQVVQTRDEMLFIRKSEANMFTQDEITYVDGDLEAYFQDLQNFIDSKNDPPALPRHPNNHILYEIYDSEVQSRGFGVEPYGL